jgi:hypothetical protein
MVTLTSLAPQKAVWILVRYMDGDTERHGAVRTLDWCYWVEEYISIVVTLYCGRVVMEYCDARTVAGRWGCWRWLTEQAPTKVLSFRWSISTGVRSEQGIAKGWLTVVVVGEVGWSLVHHQPAPIVLFLVTKWGANCSRFLSLFPQGSIASQKSLPMYEYSHSTFLISHNDHTCESLTS